MWALDPWPSAIKAMDGILAAASAKRGAWSSRVISDPPDDAMPRALGCEQAAFVEAVQSVSYLPLDASETEAAGGVEAFAGHHGPDEVRRADWGPRPADGVKHAAREFPLLEPAIGLPDSLCGNSLRFQLRCKQAECGVEMHEISAKLTELPLCSGDQTGDLGPFVDQRRHHVAFGHVPSSISNRSRGLLSSG